MGNKIQDYYRAWGFQEHEGTVINDSDLRHAYAVLGLSPPVTEARLKRRYKSLAKRWHPDRFQADPVGQAEATENFRHINHAYEVVAAWLTIAVSSPDHSSSRSETLSRKATLDL